jgi:hypothetical protein
MVLVSPLKLRRLLPLVDGADLEFLPASRALGLFYGLARLERSRPGPAETSFNRAIVMRAG